MKDTDYAFCVAAIRARETDLFAAPFINKLVEAEGIKQCMMLLKSVGWLESEEVSIREAVRNQQEDLWNFISSSVPDKNVLKYLCVLNDFFNLKVAVKCIFSKEKPDDFYVKPTTLDLKLLSKAAEKNDYNLLSDSFISNTAMSAYELACKTENGQNAETVIDSAAIEMLKKHSEAIGKGVYCDICAFIADTSNIKTAFRCCFTEKSKDFVNLAISSCFKLDRSRIIEATLNGIEALEAYLSGTCYAYGSSLYLNDTVKYDKWCDDRIIEIARGSKYTAFGFDPVCSYYYAKNSEIKTVNMILSAKQAGVPQDVLKERVRIAYA